MNTKKKIDYRQPHTFEADGTVNDLGKPLCVCGLPQDIPSLHFPTPEKKKIECMEDCCVQRREFGFSNKVTPEPSGEDWEREIDFLFINGVNTFRMPDGSIETSYEIAIDGVKLLIRELLTQQREELIEKIEKMKQQDMFSSRNSSYPIAIPNSETTKAYNEALDEILNSLKGDRKEV